MGRKGVFCCVGMTISMLLSYHSSGYIDCLVVNSPDTFYFIGFYGNPKQSIHHFSWDLLNRIGSTHSHINFGWLVGGDFNVIFYDREKKGGIPRGFTLINNFRNALWDNSLSSLDSNGPKYMWRTNARYPILFRKGWIVSWLTLNGSLISLTTELLIWTSSILTIGRYS